MKPKDNLMHDHKKIEVMLGILTKIGENIRKHQNPVLEEIDQIIEFLRLFADKLHHGKEETIYFPALFEYGMANENSPAAVMLFEHEVGRGYIRDMASAVESLKKGEKNAANLLAESIESYVELMENHILKENTILFSIGDKLIPPPKQEILYKDCQLMDSKFGEDQHQRFNELLHQLEKKYLA
ncbi:hemerythrin domain-containing protein [Bacteroides sedimenti]|uniref:Hemerythrin n=1 Tax=Bacteroides sedimenti TaxID=2136147 RepID=A0ABM8IG17_9BACE